MLHYSIGLPGNVNTFLFSSSFLSDPPTFTLAGDSSGGPPTDDYWRFNLANPGTREVRIRPGDPGFNISIEMNGYSLEAYREVRYRGKVTVTGYYPGAYVYHVTNRMFYRFTFQGRFTIEGLLILI